VPDGADITIVSIQVVTDIPKKDGDGNEDMTTTRVLATGDPNGPAGPEINLNGAEGDLRQGNTSYFRITLQITGDNRASFAHVDELQTATEPVTIKRGDDTSTKTTGRPLTRFSNGNRTAIAYISFGSSVRNLSDIPKSLIVNATAFYRDKFVNSNEPGKFGTNVPKTIPKEFRVRLFFDSRSRFMKSN
jgi:hypothetical protein